MNGQLGAPRAAAPRRPLLSRRMQRRGGTIVYVALSCTALFGLAALAVDISMVYFAKTQMQASADASALAGAWKMLNEQRLRGNAQQQAVFQQARGESVSYAAANAILGHAPVLDLNNNNNSSGGDVVLGYLSAPSNPNAALDLSNPDLFNSVQTRVRRDEIRNGSIALTFGRLLGRQNISMVATSTATFQDGVVGYRVTQSSGNAHVMPLALHINAWRDLLALRRTTGDNFAFDTTTRQVSSGSDNLHELNLYPGSGGSQLPPGNFGTVDIGSPNNSTADLSRQIRYGVNAADLAYHGGELRLNDQGFLMLNGDTGLSAGIKDDLESIIGQERAIPLFDSVSGNGNNSMFRIVGFAGVRIMEVRLTGAMNQKRVIVQPAYVVDRAALVRPTQTSSYYVFRPVMLSR